MEIGQGFLTVMAQIAAEVLAVPVAKIRVELPDTDRNPYEWQTVASHITWGTGNAVKRAAEDCREQILDLVVRALGKKREDLYLEDEKVRSRTEADFALPYRDFVINGRKTSLRGTHHGGDFPLTGYPSTDEEYWRGLFRKIREWGLNHVRFHSFCPPEAAFAAADEIGIFLQPEPGMWISTVDQWALLSGNVGHPAFRLALDAGHVHCNREGDPARIVRLQGPRIADVQVEDMPAGRHVHPAFGEGDFDVGPTLLALREVRYDGHVVVELSRDSHRAVEVATSAIAHLRRTCP